MQPIPIFIISCNRIAVLKESIDSYQGIHTPVSLVIHDNNSTYQPLLKYMKELEGRGIGVYYHTEPVAREDQLNLVAETINDWFKQNDAPYYIVTDPDVSLCGDYGDILELYTYLLDSTPEIDVVGPMLRIDDIPDFYPLKDEAIERHYKQFWHKTPSELPWKGNMVKYQNAPIDTTFGMYRKGFEFHRLCSGIRTYQPYWARHLDWYIDPNNISDDQRYYMENASSVSHWGGAWLREKISPKKQSLLSKILARLKITAV